jgi:hypothetical protein
MILALAEQVSRVVSARSHCDRDFQRHIESQAGAALTTRLLQSMRRDELKRGVVTLCIGGGRGIALALEML